MIASILKCNTMIYGMTLTPLPSRLSVVERMTTWLRHVNNSALYEDYEHSITFNIRRHEIFNILQK